ncbi:MAG: TonB-dependent copper receptor [Gammaproteobacteria bacterium]|nr:TonB-dependent copper receptor [Gammaproteobacteria bacterium]
MKHTITPVLASLALVTAPLAIARNTEELETVVVTAVQMKKPLVVQTDPKLPRQPLPAHDGADYLKTIPGFNVTRKGGTDGDPLFRGMAASRINILMDGEALLGGCGMRMDPPTAYIYPETYDRITVIKGPQTVLHGPGNSAATVMFERDSKRLEETGWKADASVTSASFGRNDEVFNVIGGSPEVYAELSATHAESDDYDDGGGNRVHSAYERWNVTGALGWTPDPDTSLELSAALSDGEAAYADRMMDGSEFSRENIGLKFSRDNVSTMIESVEAQVFYNYVDHVMDNYSLRNFAPSMMMPFPSASNPDRETIGGRTMVKLNISTNAVASVGLDYQENAHSVRSTRNETLMPYEDMDRVNDAQFRDLGLFGELSYTLDANARLIGGLRVDQWQVQDQRDTVRVGMMMYVPNPSANEHREETLESGFLRYEYDLSARPVTLYAGVGHVERFPDYWEMISDKESTTSVSAFETRPESNTQLDIGLIHRGERFSTSASLFYNDIEDYILIESGYPKGMRQANVARNVDATTWGGEIGLSYALAENWNADATLAYTRGENDTDDRPLAQQPALESRLSLNYEKGAWSAGALLRLVDDQHRYALNQGNVVGQDLGPSDAFAVTSLNAGWRASETLRFTAGIDNLFDEEYAEHISRGGAMVAGYTQTERINEPGRVAWLKLNIALR